MIPILYDRDERLFTSQGECRLPDMARCVVTEERNGIYECEFDYPIDGEYFSMIKEGMFVGVTHDDKQDIQPFEIYAHSSPINGLVTFYAHHLSYKLSSYVLTPYTASSCTGALSIMAAKSMSYCPFEFWTDKGTAGYFEIKYPVNIKSILAGEEGSILDVYGPGEFEYDKWTVKFHANRGLDNGVEIRYGKNLTDITHEYDQSEIYTAVIPYWFKEDEEGHQTLVVPSDYRAVVNEAASRHTGYWTNENDEIICNEAGEPIEFGADNTIYQAVDLSSEFDEEPTVDELVARARELFNQNKPWEPSDNIKISFVSLWQTEEYKDIAPLEKVSLCDTVRVIYTNLGIETKTKVIKTVYNVLLDRYDSIELGEAKSTYAGEIKKDLKASIEDLEDAVSKRPTSEYVTKQLEEAGDLIRGGLGGYIVMTPNADGQPQEILVLDKPDLSQAINVIRINRNGIGFSNNGYEGPFNSAWTINGTFDAQQIDVINLAATVIRTGLLTDAYGDNFWNLDTGEFHLSMETQVGESHKTLLDFADKAETIADVDVEYALSDSEKEAPTEGWVTESPEWEQGKYVWQRTKKIDGNGGIDYSEPVCIQGAHGANGANNAVVYLYARSVYRMVIPSGDSEEVEEIWSNNITYNFDEKTLSPVPRDWSTTIPDGTDPIWVTAATANAIGSTDTIHRNEWSEPVIFAQSLHSASVFLYTRAESSSGLNKPTTNLLYDFATGALTGLPETSPWSQLFPTNDGNPCFVIQATAVSTAAADVITPSEWSEIRELVADGRSVTGIKEYYAINNSTTAPADSAFGTAVQNPTATNKYLWNYEVIEYSTGTPTKTAKRIIGTYGMQGNSVTSITNYYLATPLDSGVTRSTAGWTTAIQSPTEINRFLWNYEAIAFSAGNTTYTNPTIIGTFGIGISSVVEEYYLSSSKTTQTGGNWSSQQPAWQEGKYLWTRSHIFYDNNTQDYTTPCLANAINGANEAVKNLDRSLDQQEVFNRLTNNGQNEGVYLENGHLYINGSMIKTGIISDIRSTPKNYWNLNTGYFQTKEGQIAGFTITDNVLKYGNVDVSTYAGKNKLNIGNTADIKALNPNGYDYYDSYVMNDGSASTIEFVPTGKYRASAEGSSYTETYQKMPGMYSVKITSTATATNDLNFVLTKSFSASAGQILTGCPSGGNYSSGYSLNVYDKDGNLKYTDIGSGVTISSAISGATLTIIIRKAKATSSLEFKPMVRDAGTTATYEYYWNYAYEASEVASNRIAVIGDIASMINNGRVQDVKYPFLASRTRMEHGAIAFDLASASRGWTQTGSMSGWASGIRCAAQNFIVDGNMVSWGSKNRIFNLDEYGDRLLYAYETPSPYFGDIGEGQLICTSLYTPTPSPHFDENRTYYYYDGEVYHEVNYSKSIGLNYVLEMYDYGTDSTIPDFMYNSSDYYEKNLGACTITFDDLFRKCISTQNGNYQVFLQAYGPGECYVGERTEDGFTVYGRANLSFAWEVKGQQKDMVGKRFEWLEDATTNPFSFSVDDVQNLMTQTYEEESESDGNEEDT